MTKTKTNVTYIKPYVTHVIYVTYIKIIPTRLEVNVIFNYMYLSDMCDIYDISFL